MTNDEARLLKEGDVVHLLGGRGWEPGRVVSVLFHGHDALRVMAVNVRRLGFDRAGRRRPVVYRAPRDLRAFRHPQAANVYADFLEEHGECRAAALLRERFPLDPGLA